MVDETPNYVWTDKKPGKYDTKPLFKGDRFYAPAKDGKLLVALKRAKPLKGEGRIVEPLDPVPAELAQKVTPAPKRTYRTRRLKADDQP